MDNNLPVFDQRPWGSFTILDEGSNYKVKRIEVLPGKRLSYQRHSRRSEHWFVVSGTAKVTLNDVEILVTAGRAILTKIITRLCLDKDQQPGSRTISVGNVRGAAVTRRGLQLCAARLRAGRRRQSPRRARPAAGAFCRSPS